MNLLVRPTRFERATPAFGGQYSIQLSYGREAAMLSETRTAALRRRALRGSYTAPDVKSTEPALTLARSCDPRARIPFVLPGEVDRRGSDLVLGSLRAAAGEWTTCAARATLDFAVRHRLVEPGRLPGECTAAGAAAGAASVAQLLSFDALKIPSGAVLHRI